MKTLRFAIAFAAAAAPALAFAQTAAPAAQSAGTAPGQPLVVAQASQWVNPERPSATGETRADVYRDLVQSRRDGELAALSAKLYAHH